VGGGVRGLTPPYAGCHDEPAAGGAGAVVGGVVRGLTPPYVLGVVR